MNKGFISKVTDSKLFYIIISLVASIAIWMYVSYEVNPDKTLTFSDVPIQFSGYDEIRAEELIITGVSSEKMSVTFSGKRNAVTKISDDNISISCDLSSITGTGTHMIPCEVSYPSSLQSVTVLRKSVDYVTVTVENLVEKTVPLVGAFNGKVSEGFQAEPVKTEFDTVTVSGPEELVSTIHSAKATIERNDITGSIVEDAQIMLLDKNGQLVTSDLLTLDNDTVELTLDIVVVKELPLTVNLVYGAGATSSNTTVKIEPSTITLSGSESVMKDLNSIVVTTIDLTKFALSNTDTYKLTLPNGTNNVSGTTEVTVTVSVTGLDTKKLSCSNIEYVNPPAGSSAQLVTESLDITLRGLEGTLEGITGDNIRVVADLSDLENNTGYYSVTAKVYVDGAADGVAAVGEYKVTVSIAGG